MGYSTDKRTTTTTSHLTSSPSSPSSSAVSGGGCVGSPASPAPPSPPPVILTPCAACRILRRRCVDRCVLAPYFPPTDPLKFTIAHRVFGASNIIKMLQELAEDQRADAVNSMVYEAGARIRDPVYGCAGAICQLQKQMSELQAELAKAQAEILNLQCQNTNLKTLVCMQMASSSSQQQQRHHHDNLSSPVQEHLSSYESGSSFLLEDCSFSSDILEPMLWG
ncbi:PREDICTED: LOB domain-containing protein 1-like [Ipomoea nil]|uniref:LOB domain-containing protein 1-like n=1 Tax=Ipomoea nil TaxID=35883 RepID=UPI000901F3EB|nr:PREDICTED: LOB domain-containing protein 1-like [Ipomoea nil]